MSNRNKAFVALALATLSACATVRYRNTIHPAYGDTEYNADWSLCRKENSHSETTQGYDVQIHLIVDEPKARACMKERGWIQEDSGS